MNKHILLAAWAAIIQSAYGQQHVQTNQLTSVQPTHAYQVVQGDIFIVRNPMLYRGYEYVERLEHLVDSTGKPLNILPTEPLVQVWATSYGCSDWESHTHPELGKYMFPSHLPLS